MSWIRRLFGKPITACVLLDLNEEVVASKNVEWQVVFKRGKLVCTPKNKPVFHVWKKVTVGGIGFEFNRRYVHCLEPITLYSGDCLVPDITVWMRCPDHQDV